ncbi:MAG: CDP-alcohol phosphatidyltransferase family protein [Nitrospirae bacterium]|nr:CDP-alcohol phosphatidyltransferase family protein [Nitrospirota bacterium]
MISARLGHSLDRTLAPLAKLISISPNILSVAGFAVTLGAALVIPFSAGSGGVLIIAGGVFDLLDGVVARTNGKETRFGALLDSTLDRFADAALFMAVAWLFLRQNDLGGVLLSLTSLVGAFLTSYVRARAEGLGIGCNVGLMERPERIVLLAIACVSGWFFPVIIVLFVLSYITVVQRVVHVYRNSR